MRKSAVAILIVAVIRLCNPAMIGAQETFYKGKTIRLEFLLKDADLYTFRAAGDPARGDLPPK